MMRLESCCYRCTCGRVVCRDTEPSPGEQADLCADCFDAEVTEGKLRGRDYDAWANL